MLRQPLSQMINSPDEPDLVQKTSTCCMFHSQPPDPSLSATFLLPATSPTRDPNTSRLLVSRRHCPTNGWPTPPTVCIDLSTGCFTSKTYTAAGISMQTSYVKCDNWNIARSWSSLRLSLPFLSWNHLLCELHPHQQAIRIHVSIQYAMTHQAEHHPRLSVPQEAHASQDSRIACCSCMLL
jgi:hypothetical protein